MLTTMHVLVEDVLYVSQGDIKMTVVDDDYQWRCAWLLL